MASVRLENIGHSYETDQEESQWPLRPISVTFEAGRTYALVGPSGCGKTTMLNIMSGIVKPKKGKVFFDSEDVTLLPTAKRNVAQVFQFPAIYKSMNVFDNLAFPLVCRKWESQRVKQRVGEVAEILGISDKLNRSAWRLGIDEKQLVSLGRGLVRDDVALLLLDEPLTVIDPQLKFMLRKRIKQANEVLGSTIVYVTHDQYEAMTFADELLVMSNGAVVQQGTPEQLFENPVDTYVGYFIGSPAMNFLEAECSGGLVTISGEAVAVSQDGIADGPLQVGIRPEYVSLAQAGQSAVPARMKSVQDQGSTKVVTCEIGNQQVKMKIARGTQLPASGDLLIHLPQEKCLVYKDGHLINA